MGQLLKYGVMLGLQGRDFTEEDLEVEALVRNLNLAYPVLIVADCYTAFGEGASRCPYQVSSGGSIEPLIVRYNVSCIIPPARPGARHAPPTTNALHRFLKALKGHQTQRSVRQRRKL